MAAPPLDLRSTGTPCCEQRSTWTSPRTGDERPTTTNGRAGSHRPERLPRLPRRLRLVQQGFVQRQVLRRFRERQVEKSHIGLLSHANSIMASMAAADHPKSPLDNFPTTVADLPTQRSGMISFSRLLQSVEQSGPGQLPAAVSLADVLRTP